MGTSYLESRQPSRVRGSIGDGLQDEAAEQRAVVDADFAGRGRHEDGDQFFLRVDPEVGAVGAAPGVVALAAGDGGLARLLADGKAETERITLVENRAGRARADVG